MALLPLGMSKQLRIARDFPLATLGWLKGVDAHISIFIPKVKRLNASRPANVTLESGAKTNSNASMAGIATAHMALS